MAKKTVCDRCGADCNRLIPKMISIDSSIIESRDYDLCDSCYKKVKEFLDGRDEEVE